jgi:hypothetical protein
MKFMDEIKAKAKSDKKTLCCLNLVTEELFLRQKRF